MPSDPHTRRSLRLQGYDYSQAGGYFVTICTQDRQCLFGEVAGGKAVLTDAGRMTHAVWDGLRARFTTIEVDQFVVMPNHIHGILLLVGAQFIAPHTPNCNTPRHNTASSQGAINRAPTLGEIVRIFKAATARQIRLAGLQEFKWQRNYYEHIIRDEESLSRIREYIMTNPLRWELDRENPRHKEKDDFDRWLATFKTRPNDKGRP